MMAAGKFKPNCVTAAELHGRGTSLRSELTTCAMRLAQFINDCAVWKFLFCTAQFRNCVK